MKAKENNDIIFILDNMLSFYGKEGDNINKIQLLLSKLDNVSTFRMSFLTILLFSGLCIIDWFCFAILTFFLFWAVYIFYRHYITKGKIFRLRYRKILYAFSASLLIGVFLHCGTNFFNNIYIVFLDLIMLFLFYGLHAVSGAVQIKREMQRLIPFFAYATTVFMLIGYIVMFIDKDGFKIGNYFFGIKENRFVGIFINANILAFYAVMAVVFLHLGYRMKKQSGNIRLKTKLLYLLCAAVNLLSLFLSDSNASLLFLIVYFCFLLLCGLFGSLKKIKFSQFLFRFSALILTCTVVILGMFTLRSVSQSTMAYIIALGTDTPAPPITAEIPQNPLPLEQINKKNNDSKQFEKQNITFNHENDNIDSGRFILWKQAIALFSRFPIFGIGNANIITYGEIYLGGLKFFNFHNGFFTLLVSSGVVGFMLFVVFAVTLAKSMMKVIFLTEEDKKDKGILSVFLAFCAAYCVYAFFEITFFGTITYMIAIFWLLLGYASSYVFRYERNLLRENERERHIIDRSS